MSIWTGMKTGLWVGQISTEYESLLNSQHLTNNLL